jgi:hypothetical protein
LICLFPLFFSLKLTMIFCSMLSVGIGLDNTNFHFFAHVVSVFCFFRIHLFYILCFLCMFVLVLVWMCECTCECGECFFFIQPAFFSILLRDKMTCAWVEFPLCTSANARDRMKPIFRFFWFSKEDVKTSVMNGLFVRQFLCFCSEFHSFLLLL